jgi:hypothetical protein
MIYNFFSVKGGVGTTTAACTFALQCADWFIDATERGDSAGVFAVPSGYNKNITDKLGYVHIPNLNQQMISDLTGKIVIDWGTRVPEVEGVNLLVTNSCYLAMRNAVVLSPKIDSVIFFDEPNRALSKVDVTKTLDKPIVWHIKHDPAIARAVDAGLLATRLPGGLRLPDNLTRKTAIV